jgi:RimJ/RimL family protein N-acetyltransferase
MNPILFDIPNELSSDRLRLRVPRPGDGVIVYPNVRQSLAELKQWMPWATDEYNLDGAEEWVRKSASEFLSRQTVHYLIFAREDGRHLGNIGTFAIRWKVPSCEIGYWLRTADNGKGYMTEAVGLVTRMMIETLKMRRVEIRADENNKRSRAVAERAGFQLEGILRNQDHHPVRGVQNMCMYAKVFNPAD